MRKKILCVLALVLIVSLTACGGEEDADMQTDSNYPNTIPSTSAVSDKTETPTTEATPLADSLLFEDYIAWLKSYAEKQNVPGVTNLTYSQTDGNPNLITYSCDYAEGLIHLNIATEGGKIAHILATVSPYTLIDRGECSNMSDAEVTAHALAVVPIWGINENWNYSWHAQQFANASEQGSSASIMRTYTKDNWSFTVIMGNALVSISALDNSSSFDNSGNGNTSGSGNISNDSNNSSGGNNAPEVSATEPVVKVPMNDVPYTTSLEAAVSIFDGPSYDYTYVQSVGQDGIYTIVEEAYDEEGNLWGRLKSGVGWVELSKATSQPQSESPISANFAPDSVLNSDHHEAILDHSEYVVKVAFWAHENLSNVQFSSLQFEGNSYQVAEVLYTLPELTPDKPLVTGISFPGPASIFGISFTDSSGATRCYAVFTSGRNGELILEEYN